jgi:hypothetical protein
VGPPIKALGEPSPESVSRLEEALYNLSMGAEGVHSDGGLIVAGSVARETLREV